MITSPVFFFFQVMRSYFRRADPFFDEQENHCLIGVANVFLSCLFYDVKLQYAIPIINQKGEVRRHITVISFYTFTHLFSQMKTFVFFHLNPLWCILLSEFNSIINAGTIHYSDWVVFPQSVSCSIIAFVSLVESQKTSRSR